MRAIQRRCALALRPVGAVLCAPALPHVARPVAAAAASMRSVRSLGTAANSSTAGASAPAAAPAASTSPGTLLPSQTHIVLPQLSPRMERGSVARWLLREGDEIKPHQVFMHVQTSELTEDGSPYVLEIESHESGLLRRILVGEGEQALPVGTPLAVFEDPDWSEGDRPRADFLWQAYVMQGNVRSGSCAPTREDATPDDAPAASTEHESAASSKPAKAKATKTTKPRAPKQKAE